MLVSSFYSINQQESIMSQSKILRWFEAEVRAIFAHVVSIHTIALGSNWIPQAEVVVAGRNVTIELAEITPNSWAAWEVAPGNPYPALVSGQSSSRMALVSLKTVLEFGGRPQPSPRPSQPSAPMRGAVTPWVPPPTNRRKKASATSTTAKPLPKNEPEPVAQDKLSLDQFTAAIERVFNDVRGPRLERTTFMAEVVMMDPVTIELSLWHGKWLAREPVSNTRVHAESADTTPYDVLKALKAKLMG